MDKFSFYNYFIICYYVFNLIAAGMLGFFI